MLLGAHKIEFDRPSLKSNGVYLSGVRSGPNLLDIFIPFIEIENLFYRLKPINIILIQVVPKACRRINETLFGTDSPNAYKFDVNSNGL